MPRFSIVVPAHQAALTLAETLDAIAAQTLGDWECIVVDDGSTDDTMQIATSSVRVIIEADGRKLFNQVVSRKDKPRDLTLDVKDAKELKITVDREALYAGNQVNLAEARVQK